MVRVYGLDFTSSPSPRKPMVWALGVYENDCLTLLDFELGTSVADFRTWLARPGPWIAALDFPLSQPRRFWEQTEFGSTWAERVGRIGQMDRPTWRNFLTRYRAARPSGDKQHLREVDRRAGACSPMMVAPIPVALMFHTGAPLLLEMGLSVPTLRPAKEDRIVVEAYPALVAYALASVGSGQYKSEGRPNTGRERERANLLRLLTAGQLRGYGFSVVLAPEVAERALHDERGDHLDALFAAVQATWAWRQGAPYFGGAAAVDTEEGFIADPSVNEGTRGSGKILENTA